MLSLEKNMKFKAGNYYIGDLCYVIKDELWGEFVEAWFGDKPYQQENEVTINGIRTFCAGTAHGDGSYTDNYGNVYDVDSGSIGIVEISEESLGKNGVVDAVRLINTIKYVHGQLHTFEEDFQVSAEDGVFKFLSIRIDTDYDEWDDEDGDDDYGEGY